jgi:hypothetical protein
MITVHLPFYVRQIVAEQQIKALIYRLKSVG